MLYLANQDEFLHLDQRIRSGEAVTTDDLLTAVGGLWKFYREFQPLAPLMLTRARSGEVFLGGLGDQLAGFGQDYANDEMITGFTGLLPLPEQQSCHAALPQGIYYDHPAEKPYSKLDQSQIETCLARMDVAAKADSLAILARERGGVQFRQEDVYTAVQPPSMLRFWPVM